MLPISYDPSGERQFFVLVNLSESKQDTASIMQSFTSSASLYGLPLLPRMYLILYVGSVMFVPCPDTD